MPDRPDDSSADGLSPGISCLTELAMDCSCALGNLLLALKREDEPNQIGRLLRSLMVAYEKALEPMEDDGHWFMGEQPVCLLGMYAPSWHQWTFWAAREVLRTAMDAQEIPYAIDVRDRFWIDGPSRQGLEVVRDAIGILLLGTGAVSLPDAIGQINPLIHFLDVEAVNAERRASGGRGRFTPFAAVRAARRPDKPRTPSQPCPLCGGPVRLNATIASGNRYLRCIPCGHQWRCTSANETSREHPHS